MRENTTVRTDWTPQELAEEIATVIRLRPELWNQHQYFSIFVESSDQMRAILAGDEEPEPECGTTGCVAGWGAVLTSPPGTRLTTVGSVYQPGIDGRLKAGDITQAALGLGYGQAAWLFSEHRSQREVLTALDAIAAGQPWPYDIEDDDIEDDDF